MQQFRRKPIFEETAQGRSLILDHEHRGQLIQSLERTLQRQNGEILTLKLELANAQAEISDLRNRLLSQDELLVGRMGELLPASLLGRPATEQGEAA